MSAQHFPEALHWQLLRGRIAQIEAGLHQLLSDVGLSVPEWPFDKSRVVKVALLEAEAAVRRAEEAAAGAVEIAKMAETIPE